MLELADELFSGEGFMPHGHCYLWKPGLIWLQVVSNSLIGLAYVAISVTLAYLVRRGQYVPFKGMALAFGVFIVSCGLTHFFDVWTVWNPLYWVDGGVRAVTAAASVGTALMLPPLIPRAIALARGARAAQERGVELEAAIEDLEHMYEKTKELDNIKTQFFANVSHELRTPLALILGPMEKLLQADNLSDEQRRDAQVVMANGRTLLKHVNDLLDVARLESGRLEARYAHVDLARLLRLLAANFEALADDQRNRFDVEAPAELMVDIDPDKIERVVLNLLSNAFKFTPAGGAIRCRLATQEASGGARVVLEVADSGPGVNADQKELIFERFRQADGGSTREFGGVGLGLAISKDFVELHGGSISVHDAPEGGALFRVTLPVVAPAGAAVSPAEPTSSEMGPAAVDAALAELRERVEDVASAGGADKPLVLVVEDNRDMSRFLCDSLAADYRTASAFDGRSGLERALELMPDLILSDVMMPGMSGEELVRELRTRHEMDGIPILLLTAKADDDLRVRLLREGAQDYVMKPCTATELHARVSNLITMKRARDILRHELDTQMEDLERLAREVSSRKRELQTAFDSMRVAREHAERASQLKTNFLRLVSHELRTPLASLQLQLERLQADPPQELSSEKRELLMRMRGSTGRLNGLIDGLLDYARIEAGRLTVQVQSFDVVSMAGDVVDELRPQAEAKGIHLDLRAQGDLGPISSDPQLARLILVNLVGNGIKFTTAGSVEVALDAAEGAVRMTVTDTGPGIPPAEQARIFEPFEQVEPVRRTHLPGAGLGLALVREIAASLGATVQVDSRVGEGSTFTVVLPPLA